MRGSSHTFCAFERNLSMQSRMTPFLEHSMVDKYKIFTHSLVQEANYSELLRSYDTVIARKNMELKAYLE